MMKKKSKRRFILLGIPSIIAIAYFFVILFSYSYNYFCLKKEETDLKNELISLQDEKSNLKIEIEKLNDPEYVARYAKENFLYSADGEYIIKIDTEEKNPTMVQSNNQLIYIISICGVSILILMFMFIRYNKKNNLKKQF